MSLELESKKELGQFFTANDPFTHRAFCEWAKQFSRGEIILEPFAGANHLIDMLQAQGLAQQFTSFDIVPAHPYVRKRDVLKNFPQGYQVCITNPPYLAKNSATRSSTPIPDLAGYDNLWKLSIHTCLEHCSYVAAIIPESFITSKAFKDRLHAVISLPTQMFSDTDQPSCLALWDPRGTKSYEIYSGEKLLGTNLELKAKMHKLLPKIKEPKQVSFNIPSGTIGIQAIDNTKKDSIAFVSGDTFQEADVKNSSRTFTRVSVDSTKPSDEIIADANALLKKYRKDTGDVFLTAFKGLRDDGKFRRRLSWDVARKILQQVAE